ncbi:MAG: hypothetical protein ACRET7_11915 [Burkholderiales bacterium]
MGRKFELDEIKAALLPVSGAVRAVAVCAVQGMPGIGKSYLAERFAQWHRERFPPAGLSASRSGLAAHAAPRTWPGSSATA